MGGEKRNATGDIIPTGLDTVDVTLTVDTAIYASGDVLSDTAVITNALRPASAYGLLKGITVFDRDDEGAAFDIFILKANRSFGTKNIAPSITDDDAADIIGAVSIAGADLVDIGGLRVATKAVADLPLYVASGRDLWVTTITRGTPTYTSASDLRLRFLIQPV